MDRTKIIYIIGQLDKGGAEKQLYELVKGIDKDRFEPIVISLSQGGYWADKIRKLGIELIEFPWKKHIEFGRLFKLIKIFREKKPDIVHTYMHSGNAYGRIAAALTRVPVIIASERSLPEIGKNKNYYQIFVDKLFASFTNGIICNSHIAAETLTTKYSFDTHKVFTVRNGTNITPFLKENSRSQKQLTKKVVGIVGSLYPVKNHKLFLDMAKNVIDKFNDRDVTFLIVGEGPLRDKLERYSKRLGISNYVTFTGSRNDIPDLLQMIDVFVLTSHYEGLSNAIMEAMASGIPCVATDVGGNSELVLDGETGYIVPPNDLVTMTQKVLYLLKDRHVAKEMGIKGRRRIEESFCIVRMVENTEEVYRKLRVSG